MAGAALAVLWLPGEARAACAPGSPVNNADVTCTGTTTNQNSPNGYGTNTDTGNTVAVVPGATVTGTNAGIIFASGTVLNSGSITGTGGGAIGISAGTSASVTNSGSITGSFDGILAGSSVNVTNSATISGGFAGIVASTGAAIVNNSGSISSSSDAIAAGTSATVTNSGIITSSFSAGINAGTSITVSNFNSITSSFGTGVNAGTSVNVTNTATISGGVAGIVASTGAATVSNSGNISGGNGDGILAGTSVNVNNSGSITGTGAGVAGISAGTSATVKNSGSITGSFDGIFAGTSADVTNSVTISGGFAGIVANTGSATVNNSGSITGSNDAIFAGTSATVSNSGSITSSFSAGIDAGTFAVVSNSGNISGGGDGILAGTSATVTNTATISGGVAGIVASTGSATVNNSGTISGGSGDGILAGTSANVINSGSITGTGGGAIGISAGTSASVTNSGSITGSFDGILAGSVNVTNSAIIAGGFSGIVASTGSATVTNSGSITGSNDAIFAATSATVTNSGTITSSFSAGIDAGQVAVINLGGITGVVGINASAGASSVFNGGTITGTGGTAIQFSGLGNTLTLAPTSIIAGNVLGTGADTFQLGGSGTGGFDASQIGPAVQYRGFGTFNKTGDSFWTLSGTNALVLPWTVQQGTLDVTGTLANSTFTVNGGLLTGNGTVAATQINNGGTFAPGTPGTPGTSMTISGSLAFQSGAVYLVQVNPSTASLANVSGTATLAGNVLVNFAPGNYVKKQYDVLHAAGLSGTFAGANSANMPGFALSLSYTNTDVLLNLTAGLGAGGGLNVNQQTVANVINGFFNNGGSLPPGFGTLFGLSGSNLSSALSQVSGETATGSQQTTFNAMGMFMGILTDPFIDGRGGDVSVGPSTGASAYAAQDKPRSNAARDANAMFTKAPVTADPFAQRWSVWAAGYGGSQTTDGNATLGSNSTTSRIYGTAVGADYRLSPYTLAGFALAGGGTNFSVVNGGSGRSDLFQAGAFIRHNAGAAYFSGALAYGWQDITTNRIVIVDQLRAEFNANAWSGRVEGGYRFVSPWMGGVGLTPYAAGQFTTFELPAYAEQAITGASSFALAYASKSVTDTRSELGLRTDKSYAMLDGILTLRGRVAWAHDFSPDRNIGATFQTLPGASFVVNGAAQASDSALVTASVEKKWLNGWSAAATFEGEFSSVTTSYAGKSAVRYSW